MWIDKVTFLVIVILVVVGFIRALNKKDEEWQKKCNELENKIKFIKEDNWEERKKVIARKDAEIAELQKKEIAFSLDIDEEDADYTYKVLENQFYLGEFFEENTKEGRISILTKARKEYVEEESFSAYAKNILVPMAKNNYLEISTEDIENARENFIKKNDIPDLEKLEQIEYRKLNDEFRNTNYLIRALENVVDNPIDAFCVFKSNKYKLQKEEVSIVYDCFKNKFNLTTVMEKNEFLELEGLNELDRETESLDAIFIIMLMFSKDIADVIEYSQSNLPEKCRNHYLINSAIFFELSNWFFNTIYYRVEHAVTILHNRKENLKQQVEKAYETDKTQITRNVQLKELADWAERMGFVSYEDDSDEEN